MPKNGLDIMNRGGFLIAVRDPVLFPRGGACCSQGGSLTSSYSDGSAWEM